MSYSFINSIYLSALPADEAELEGHDISRFILPPASPLWSLTRIYLYYPQSICISLKLSVLCCAYMFALSRINRTRVLRGHEVGRQSPAFHSLLLFIYLCLCLCLCLSLSLSFSLSLCLSLWNGLWNCEPSCFARKVCLSSTHTTNSVHKYLLGKHWQYHIFGTSQTGSYPSKCWCVGSI